MHQNELNELLKLANEKTLVEVVLRYWLGREPNENEKSILEKMMILVVDHRSEAPSAEATIAAAKEGKDLLRSVEVGIEKIDTSHGGAVEGLVDLLYEDKREVVDLVKDYLDKGERIPGFGHRLYTDFDPRTKYLFDLMTDLKFDSKFRERVEAIEAELEKQKGKRLVINVDGAMAVVLATLGVKAELANAFFLWPRVAGLVYRFLEARLK